VEVSVNNALLGINGISIVVTAHNIPKQIGMSTLSKKPCFGFA